MVGTRSNPSGSEVVQNTKGSGSVSRDEFDKLRNKVDKLGKRIDDFITMWTNSQKHQQNSQESQDTNSRNLEMEIEAGKNIEMEIEAGKNIEETCEIQEDGVLEEKVSELDELIYSEEHENEINREEDEMETSNPFQEKELIEAKGERSIQKIQVSNFQLEPSLSLIKEGWNAGDNIVLGITRSDSLIKEKLLKVCNRIIVQICELGSYVSPTEEMLRLLPKSWKFKFKHGVSKREVHNWGRNKSFTCELLFKWTVLLFFGSLLRPPELKHTFMNFEDKVLSKREICCRKHKYGKDSTSFRRFNIIRKLKLYKIKTRVLKSTANITTPSCRLFIASSSLYS